jgi:hypothetical protein
MSPTSNRDDDDHSDATTSVSWTGDTRTRIIASNGSTTTTPQNSYNNNTSSSSSNENADTTITTFDLHPSSSSSSNHKNSSSGYSNTTDDATRTTTPNTARWTRYLPEALGIRRSVESSKYRWCARESALWGIATGSAMAFHRIRMNSPMSRVIHVGFSTVFIVMGGSYYFCVKRRDYQEQMIELLMQLNTFEPVQNMPAERPIDQTHPFVMPDTNNNNNNNNNDNEPIKTKQYVAHIPERKEWQTPIPTQDAANIFQPYTNDKGDHNNSNDGDQQ